MSQINFSQTVQQMIETIKTQFLSFLETFEQADANGRPVKIYREQAIQMKLQEKNTIYIDFTHLLNFSNDNNVISDTILSDYYRVEPHLRKVVANFVFSVNNTSGENENYFLSFYDIPFSKKLRDMRTSEIGKLTSIKGLVTRSTEVRPELLYGCFNCSLCNTEIREVEQQFKFTEPKVCSNPGCNNHNKWTLKTANSVFSDFQKLRVQEESTDIPAGGMPRCIDVVVRNEIVDQAKPGDKCIFTGCLVVVPDITALTKPGEKTEMSIKNEGVRVRNEGTNDGITGLSQLGQRDLNYKLVFLANNIQTNQSRFNVWEEEDIQDLTEEEETQKMKESFTIQELENLDKMKRSDHIYERLASSIAPTVHGHLEIKKGILLMLFGGINKKTEEGINLRGDINICMVGDPSTAKSQFLKYVNKIVPRSVYTSGKASTSAGLTASVTRDPETGENCIEAGALMLSDQGICCIDEFDKMDKKDQVAIHEAMEQQTISIAKAGIQATLNARTSILAAANPLFGRYDKSKSLKYNLDISAPIMSRFDLFFIILDECNEQADKLIATHIVELHNSSGSNVKPEFTTEELKRYIRFGRTIKPIFTHEAALELQKSYVQLRQNDVQSQKASYRITVRQLESLIRLSEAIARVYLSKEIHPDFVKEAARLLKSSIVKIERGQHDYLEDEEEKIDYKDTKDQNIIQEEIEAKEQAERKKQNKIKITFEDYLNMKKIIVQTITQLDVIDEEKAIKQAAQSDGMEEEKKYGQLQKDIVESILDQMIQNDLINSQEQALELKKIYNSVIKKLIDVDHVLIVTEDDHVFEQRRLSIHPNYVEDN